MKQQVKELLLARFSTLTLPKSYTGFTLIEELFNIYQLQNSTSKVVLHPEPYNRSLTISNDVLLWAQIDKKDLEKLGLKISYYEDVIKENLAIITQLTLSEWIEKVL